MCNRSLVNENVVGNSGCGEPEIVDPSGFSVVVSIKLHSRRVDDRIVHIRAKVHPQVERTTGRASESGVPDCGVVGVIAGRRHSDVVVVSRRQVQLKVRIFTEVVIVLADEFKITTCLIFAEQTEHGIKPAGIRLPLSHNLCREQSGIRHCEIPEVNVVRRRPIQVAAVNNIVITGVRVFRHDVSTCSHCRF